MIRFHTMLFFICLSANAQKLDLKIDSIAVNDDDVAERVFVVHYHLENLTNENLRFFLDTTTIVPSTGGSGTNFPFYKMYENDTFLEIGNVFSGSNRSEFNFEEMNVDSLIATFQKKIESMQSQKQSILDKMITMTPREIKKFSIDFYWNRNRYYQNQDTEYYLEEKAQHFIEITAVLQKNSYKKVLPEAFFSEITADPYFIEGVFTSNKYQLDFGKL